jgi:TonB family protein
MRFYSFPLFRLTFAIASSVPLLPLSQAGAQQAQSALPLTPSQQDQLRDLGKRVLDHADHAGCKKNSCTILVVNFAGPSGATSVLGMQLADALSEQLASASTGIRIADRRVLQAFLEKERIDSKLLEEDNAARWLAIENSANAVLVGFLRPIPDGKELRVQLLDAHGIPRKDDEKAGPIDVIKMTGLDSQLSPAEPFGSIPVSSKSGDGTVAARAGIGGTSVPRCLYCPTPQYNDVARKAKFAGHVVALVTVSVDGSASDIQIVNGAPFGLNRSSMEAIRAWKFKPAMKDGNPVPVDVPVETAFRLY